jgi:response regulator RpfG family c-di-GMP phosphodiesterase
VLAVTRPEAALAELAHSDVSVLLADQRMPGMDGVELLAAARQRHPVVIGVLITAYADIDAAVQAINEARAFAFLEKPWDTDELLVVVRRAVEANRALRRQRGELRDQHQRELAGLEELSRSAPAPVTAQRFGAAPLRERAPDQFDDLLRRYTELLEHAVEERIYRVDHHISDALGSLADELGRLRAGPRDVVNLHTAGLKRRLATVRTDEAEAYTEEGRLLLLELMGHLVSYYRGYALGVSA